MEGRDVGGACPTPPVNRLIGVAHRSDPRWTEQLGEQARLGVGRVLVFVENDHSKAIAVSLCDVGTIAKDPASERHLVRELDHASALFLGDEFPCEWQNGFERPDHGKLFAECVHGLGGLARQILERGDSTRIVKNGVVVGDVELTEFRGEANDRINNGIKAESVFTQSRVRAGRHHFPRNRKGGRLGDDGRIGIPADSGGMFGEDFGREGVVGRHGWSGEPVVVVREVVDGDSQFSELRTIRPNERNALAKTFGQFASRFSSEGESQNLLGSHALGCDEPQRPKGHRFGLAASGTGEDKMHSVFAEVNDVRLFLNRREGQSEDFFEVGGGDVSHGSSLPGFAPTLFPGRVGPQVDRLLPVRRIVRRASRHPSRRRCRRTLTTPCGRVQIAFERNTATLWPEFGDTTVRRNEAKSPRRRRRRGRCG